MAPGNRRMPCHNATEIAKQLSNKYDEAPVAFGLQSNGNLLQVYASEDKGTWTVVSTSPAGMSCIVAAGKRWESLPYIKTTRWPEPPRVVGASEGGGLGDASSSRGGVDPAGTARVAPGGGAAEPGPWLR